MMTLIREYFNYIYIYKLTQKHGTHKDLVDEVNHNKV